MAVDEEVLDTEDLVVALDLRPGHHLRVEEFEDLRLPLSPSPSTHHVDPGLEVVLAVLRLAQMARPTRVLRRADELVSGEAEDFLERRRTDWPVW